MSSKTMHCLTCSRVKAWPDGFPDTTSNRACWRCHFLDHIRTEHPATMRRIRRTVRKRAKSVAEKDILRGAFGDDRTLLRLASGEITVHPAPDTPPAHEGDDESETA